MANKGKIIPKRGLTKHRFYIKWGSMMARCYCKTNKKYPNYGGRGIGVSEEFKNPAIFTEYLDKLPGYGVDGRVTLDRIKNDKWYERDNLRWANATEQANNRRDIRSNNKSGYTGVRFRKDLKCWLAYIYANGKQLNIAQEKDIHEAVKKRNDYIIKNSLPMKIQNI